MFIELRISTFLLNKDHLFEVLSRIKQNNRIFINKLCSCDFIIKYKKCSNLIH